MKIKTKPIMCGKIKPIHKEKFTNTEKQPLDELFLSSPNSTCKISPKTTREIGEKITMDSRLQSNQNMSL